MHAGRERSSYLPSGDSKGGSRVVNIGRDEHYYSIGRVGREYGKPLIIYVRVLSKLDKAQSGGGYWVRPIVLLAHGCSCEMQIMETANFFVDFKMLGVSTFHHVCLLETYLTV